MTPKETSIFAFTIGTAKQIGKALRAYTEGSEEFSGRERITTENYHSIRAALIGTYREKVLASNLATKDPPTEDDIWLVYGILSATGDLQQDIIPNRRQRTWTFATQLHWRQTDIVAMVTATMINENNKREVKLDVNRIRVKALIHDVGRFASNDPILHGPLGGLLLKSLGFHSDYITSTLAHLRSGMGPNKLVNEISMEKLLTRETEKVQAVFDSFSLEEMIIALADMSKEQNFDTEALTPNAGALAGRIAHPVERQYNTYTNSPAIRQFTKELVRYIEDKYNIDFNEVIAQAKGVYKDWYR